MKEWNIQKYSPHKMTVNNKPVEIISVEALSDSSYGAAVTQMNIKVGRKVFEIRFFDVVDVGVLKGMLSAAEDEMS